ncbi:MAG TPA: hypothetical protein VLF63_01545 [Patescibacteria group bacterium]|nr:hypothetical protein [Patescibacteria group bacterium]
MRVNLEEPTEVVLGGRTFEEFDLTPRYGLNPSIFGLVESYIYEEQAQDEESRLRLAARINIGGLIKRSLLSISEIPVEYVATLLPSPASSSLPRRIEPNKIILSYKREDQLNDRRHIAQALVGGLVESFELNR